MTVARWETGTREIPSFLGLALAGIEAMNAEKGVKETKTRKEVKGHGNDFCQGETYWIKYYRHGKPYRESSHSRKETDAKAVLKKGKGK